MELSPPAIHDEVEAGRSAAVRKQLVLLSGTINRNSLDVGELLYEADEANMFKSWGFRGLGEYAEKELGIKERKSQYLIRIIRVCRAVGLKRTQYEPVGISKLREITTLDPNGTWFNPETKLNEPLNNHIINLIIEAPDLIKEEVTEEVLKLKNMTGGNRPVVRSFSMPLAAWENTVKKAFERMRMRLGSQGRDNQGMAREFTDGRVFELICADWLSGDVEEPSIPMEEELGRGYGTMYNEDGSIKEKSEYEPKASS